MLVPESADFSMPPFSLLVILNLSRPYYTVVFQTKEVLRGALASLNG